MNIEFMCDELKSRFVTQDKTVASFKEKQLELFKTNGLKEISLDSYKFTDLNLFLKDFNFKDNGPKDFVPDYNRTFPTITFLNGTYFSANDLPKGIIIKKVKDSFSEISHFLENTNPLSALHHALIDEGVVIEVEKNTQISSPIRILHLAATSGMSTSTNIVIAHPFSKLTLIEETAGFEIKQAFINETYLVADEGATIEHIQVDQLEKDAFNHITISGKIHRDATIRSLIFNTSGRLSRKNLSLSLMSQGANAESFGLYLTNGNEHSDINTVINHISADTSSKQIAKGILDNESKGIFTGKIHIHPKAQRVVSSQINKNLLLSNKAQVHSQPQLEIFADDVKCSHGSTTGQLSTDEVFYFMARGIPETKAKTILAEGFGLEVVEQISNLSARDYVKSTILSKLVKKFNLGAQK